MPVSAQKLLSVLQKLDIVEAELLHSLYVEAGDDIENFIDLLIKSSPLQDREIGQIIAEENGLPFIDLGGAQIERQVLQLLPKRQAERLQMIVFDRSANELSVAIRAQSKETEIMSALLQKKTGLPIKIYCMTKRGFLASQAKYGEELQAQIDTEIGSNTSEWPASKVVESILNAALEQGASDVHFEPDEQYLRVRFRQDGQMSQVAQLPKANQDNVVTRIKVLAKLLIDEHQAAQDGRLSYSANGKKVDARVSIVPTAHGESIVIRLLDTSRRRLALADLGMSDAQLKQLEAAYSAPHGMILVTGPTGSGKTTTLYSILSILNDPKQNIMTIEDPIEYTLDNINQIQVNLATNLTFADGLRSIVRQDPDVVLVGEIRDSETASIAVNASLTGHLVFSSLHTNDAPTAFPRLIDMGVEPYLFASTIRLVVAQRLVRRLCEGCRRTMDEQEKAELTALPKVTSAPQQMYTADGCEHCNHTGYSGRIALFEIMPMSDGLRKAVKDKQDAGELRKIAIAEGMQTMLQDGIAKVDAGITSLSEVLRVTQDQ